MGDFYEPPPVRPRGGCIAGLALLIIALVVGAGIFALVQYWVEKGLW